MKKLSFIVFASICLAALIASFIQGEVEFRKQLTQLDIRAASMASGAEESLRANLAPDQTQNLKNLLARLASRQPISGIATCSPSATGIIAVGHPMLAEWTELCKRTVDAESSWTTRIRGIKAQINRSRILTADNSEATLLIAQDLAGARRAFRESFARTFFVVLLSMAAVLFLVASQIRFWLKGYGLYLYRSLRALGQGRSSVPRPRGFLGIPGDIEHLTAKILTLPVRPRAPVAAPKEPSLVDALKATIQDREVVVIANREPYIHRHKGDKIEVIRPASGLVTALEPILRNCGGLWVGHGSGNADRETSDANGEVQVPPGKPSYTLKRIWLSEEEEKGYYYGFSNEGLWPLCHHAHHRPTFRLSDWQNYVQVNQRFANELPQRTMNDKSLVLVQDYHFALLPKLIKERSPSTKVSLFWHIPWPNPESFGICPWSQELLEGMLGADVVGFHTQFHCNNFLETCDRFLEARIDWERFSVIRGDHETLVRPFPIGIDTSPVKTLSDDEVQALKLKYGIKAEFVAVGVDRIDYTKGLVERIESVGRFLEKNPDYVGRFSLVQMGSPSRTSIPAYRLLAEEVEAVVAKVNGRFAGKGPEGWEPVQFIGEHHEWDDIQYFYQLGDICMVTSLHDGMNLVAKEYVWCQRADRGSLILSKFTGASRELTEAYVVNPYSVEETSDAIAAALSLTPSEKSVRMTSMKEKIANHNAFHWAADLIRALVQDVITPGDPKVKPEPPFKPAPFPGLRSARRAAGEGASVGKRGLTRR